MLGQVAFEQVRDEVEAMMLFDESFQDVERAIDRARLPEESRAALWLVAWTLNDRRSR